jgi:hypothetical protein
LERVVPTFSIDETALRRRVLRALGPIASYLGILQPDSASTDNAALAKHVDAVAAKAEDALIDEEHSLADAIADIDRRFQATWPTSPAELLAHVRRELVEVERAMADADRRSTLRREVVVECGDAMLLLGRIALHYGAESGVEPLAIAVRKVLRRLGAFEGLVGTMAPADAWRSAKVMTRNA